MSSRESAVHPNYKPIRNDELKPIGLIYKGMLSGTGVLALFTAQDAEIDGTWVTAMGNAIVAVGNIVPSRTIILMNRDITAQIRLNSKKSVLYGKVLSYWLEKTFPGETGRIAAFPIVQANKKMADGDTEGFLFDVNTIIQQIEDTANHAALVAKGWPVSNLTNYQTMRTSVEGLNIQQELAKKLVPENTDGATTIRNTCYGYIQTLVKLKDIVYAGQPLKIHEWTVKANISQIRGGNGGAAANTVVREANVVLGEIKEVDTTSFTTTATTMVEIVITGNDLRWSAASSAGPVMGPIIWTTAVGSYLKTPAEFAALIGAGPGNAFVKVQNLGPGMGHYKVTWTNVG